MVNFSLSNGLINLQDETNIMKMRTIKNSPIGKYNCAGYALNTFNWFLPFEDIGYDRFNDGDIDLPFDEQYLNYMTIYLLQHFPTLHLISQEEIKNYPRHEIIAFRIGCDDFHFIIRKKNYIWYHKMGNQKIKQTKTNMVLNDLWDFDTNTYYESKIIFFVRV